MWTFAGRSSLFRTATRTQAPIAASSTMSVSRRFLLTDPVRILVTGGLGQVGTDVVSELRSRLGADNVVVTDIHKPKDSSVFSQGPYKYLDVLDYHRVAKMVVENNISTIVHLSAIMSVLGESIPQKAMDLNIDGVRNVLEVARHTGARVFIPSTMAVFGADAGKVMTKDDTILNPTTIYGITKVFLEHVGNYYQRKYDIDFRSLRYPGIISAATLPGGGTTDYAVHMYHYALRGEKYVCPVLPDEPLPMMYMPDCVKATVEIILTEPARLNRRVYNIAALSFTPAELVKSIRKIIPDFQVEYKRGLAQDIAHSWPDSMDDTNARSDWGWGAEWDLDRMTKDMLTEIPRLHPEVAAARSK